MVVAVGNAGVRERVEGDLVGVGARRCDLALVQQRVGLVEQLVDRALAGARHGLVGGDHQPLDPGLVVQRLERDDHLHRRAVRVGDDPVVACERLGVDLADDERHVVVMRQREELSTRSRRPRQSAAPTRPRSSRPRRTARGRSPGSTPRSGPARRAPPSSSTPDRALRGERRRSRAPGTSARAGAEHQRADLSGGAHDGYPIALAHGWSGYRGRQGALRGARGAGHLRQRPR